MSKMKTPSSPPQTCPAVLGDAEMEGSLKELSVCVKWETDGLTDNDNGKMLPGMWQRCR